MQEQLYVTYTAFKASHGELPLYYIPKAGGTISIFCVTEQYLIMCNLTKEADILDFEASMISEATEIGSKRDAIALASIASRRLLNLPKTSDGKPIVLPCLFPGGVYLYISGAGDDAGYGDGAAFTAASDEEGNSVVEWHFNDWVYIAGGKVSFQGATVGDWVTMELIAPATAVTPNANNQGNCNIVNSVVIVPAAGNGAYDVDLATAVPIPTDADEVGVGSGYWNWSNPETGKGTITASAPGAGFYHLLATSMTLVRFVNRVPLLGNDQHDITVPAIKPKKVLPHWTWKVTVHNSGHAGLKVNWYTVVARATTSS